MGVGFVLCSLTRRLVFFEASLVMLGMFGAMAGIAGMSLLVGLYPAWKRRILAITLVSYSLPSIIFPVLAQHLLSVASQGQDTAFAVVFHLPFAIVGLILIGGGLLLGGLHRADATSQIGAHEPVQLRKLLSQSILLIVFLAALHGSSDNTLSGWMPKYMTASFEHLPLSPGVVLALFSLVYVIARGLLAALPEGTGQRAFLTLAGPLGGLLMLGTIWRGNAIQVGLLYPLAGFMWCLEYPSLLSEIESRSEVHFSTVLMGASLVSSLLTFVQLNIVGWVADRTGSLRWAMTPAALGFVAFGLVAAVSGLGKRAVEPSKPPLRPN